ncbi:hypothetical protein LJE98_15255 [Rhizobium ipomoeae]|nr:hypothetical protein [Rhizobium sp. 'Codium 1']
MREFVAWSTSISAGRTSTALTISGEVARRLQAIDLVKAASALAREVQRQPRFRLANFRMIGEKQSNLSGNMTKMKPGWDRLGRSDDNAHD